MVFKCASCGSCMIYNFEKNTLECPNCGSTGQPEPHADSKDNFTICPICGGELPLGQFGSACKCGYCDSYVVSDVRTSGEYVPAAIVPSLISKRTVFSLLEEKFSGYLCLIPEVFSEKRLKEVIIEYVPYWIYDFGMRASYSGELRRSTELGSRTRIDKYHIEKVMDIEMGSVPVDASDKMPDDIMDELEPFDLSTAIPFRQEFLSGSESEIFNRESEYYKEEASLKASDKAYDFIYNDISKQYRDLDGLSRDSIPDCTSLNITTLDRKYYLLPVYKYSYLLRSGKSYDYYVNGQTREIYGKAPISRQRLITACAATVTAFAGIAAIIVTIMMAVGGAL